jgi:hypothetical protein
VVAIHVRDDYDDGSKKLWWEQPDGTRGLGGRRTADLPLYGIDQLDEATGVILVEGEQTRDALAPPAAELGLAVVATVTGATTCPSAAALRPLLGYEVFVWPDHDRAGGAHMEQIAHRLLAMDHDGERLRRINAPSLVAQKRKPPTEITKNGGDGADAADWAAVGGDPAALRQLLDAATSIDAQPSAEGHQWQQRQQRESMGVNGPRRTPMARG